MGQQTKDRLFWLHVKKSAGMSTRRMLGPLYTEVERGKKPACFIQSRPEEYNDILNNYRVVLGEYQFRRCLFAKKFLYPDDFDRHFKVAFSRNPIDRCVSQFFYMWHKPGRKRDLKLRLMMAKQRRFSGRLEYNFDRFLAAIEEARQSESNSWPHGLHFQTHTAAMWPDIVDENDTVLLDCIYRLEDLTLGVNHIRETLDQPPLEPDNSVRTNTSSKSAFAPSSDQVRKIEELFGKDFDIYEGLCERF